MNGVGFVCSVRLVIRHRQIQARWIILVQGQRKLQVGKKIFTHHYRKTSNSKSQGFFVLGMFVNKCWCGAAVAQQTVNLLVIGSNPITNAEWFFDILDKLEVQLSWLEHRPYMARVIGSNPVTSTNGYQSGTRLSETGGNGDNKIGNWRYRIVAIAADCKSALIRVRWFESIYLHQWKYSSVGRAPD